MRQSQWDRAKRHFAMLSNAFGAPGWRYELSTTAPGNDAMAECVPIPGHSRCEVRLSDLAWGQKPREITELFCHEIAHTYFMDPTDFVDCIFDSLADQTQDPQAQAFIKASKAHLHELEERAVYLLAQTFLAHAPRFPKGKIND